MVVLNLTFLVQLGLFLVFLTVMHFLVLRPTLRVTDRRDEKMDADRQAAEADHDEAAQLETQYASELGAVRRDTATQVAQAQRAAQEKHVAALAEHRRQGDQTVAAVRAAAVAHLDEQRKQYDGLTPELAEAIAKGLGLGRDNS